MDHRYWKREVEDFSKHFCTISLSRRHHWPAQPDKYFCYSSEQHMEDLLEFIKTLGMGPVHLVGHSYGGYVAASLACANPEMIRSLTLVEPVGPIEGQRPGRSRIEDQRLGASLVSAGQLAEGVSHFLDTVCFHPRWQDGDPAIRFMSLRNAGTIVQQVCETRRAIRAQDLAKFDRPVLLMKGVRSPSPISETLERIGQLIDHAQTSNIPAASHLTNFDNYPAFFDTLMTFLLEHINCDDRHI